MPKLPERILPSRAKSVSRCFLCRPLSKKLYLREEKKLEESRAFICVLYSRRIGLETAPGEIRSALERLKKHFPRGSQSLFVSPCSLFWEHFSAEYSMPFRRSGFCTTFHRQHVDQFRWCGFASGSPTRSKRWCPRVPLERLHEFSGVASGMSDFTPNCET